jgi:hypothetical protein
MKRTWSPDELTAHWVLSDPERQLLPDRVDLTFRTLCRSAEAFLGSTLKTGSGSQSMRRL